MLDGVGIFASWVCPRCPRMGGSKLRMVYIVALKRIMCLVFDRVNGSATAGWYLLDPKYHEKNIKTFSDVCDSLPTGMPRVDDIFSTIVLLMSVTLLILRSPFDTSTRSWVQLHERVTWSSRWGSGWIQKIPGESTEFPQHHREPRRIMTNLGYVETIRNMLKLHPPIWCWNLFCFDLSLGDGMWFKWLSSPSDHLSKQQLLAGNLAISDPRFQGWVLQVEGIQKRLLCSWEDHPCYCGDSDLIM
jgi:hypothetical protein